VKRPLLLYFPSTCFLCFLFWYGRAWYKFIIVWSVIVIIF
jgi:hypothetical protein